MKRKIICICLIHLLLATSLIPLINVDAKTLNSSDDQDIFINLCGLDILNVREHISDEYQLTISKDKVIEIQNIFNDIKNDPSINFATNRIGKINAYEKYIEDLYSLDIFPEDLSLDNLKLLTIGIDEDFTKNQIDAIFYDLLVILDNLNLLPEGKDIDDVKESIEEDINELNNMLNYENLVEENSIYDMFCLVSGEVHENTIFSGPISTSYIHFIYFIIKLNELLLSKGINFLNDILEITLVGDLMLMATVAGVLLSNYNPIPLGHQVGFGGISNRDNEIIPGRGWIKTYGLGGKKTIEGDLVGNIPTYPIPFLFVRFYPGISGFTGIRIDLENNGMPIVDSYFLGTAALVNIGHNRQNIAPEKVDSIKGPTQGKVGKEYKYSFSTTDPNNDKLYYLVDWGNSSNSELIGPYNSGEKVDIHHSWKGKGNYDIEVSAISEKFEEGAWSNPLSVTMPKSRQIETNLLTRFLELFPMIGQFLYS